MVMIGLDQFQKLNVCDIEINYKDPIYRIVHLNEQFLISNVLLELKNMKIIIAKIIFKKRKKYVLIRKIKKR
jgi:hypothetical protein